MARGVEEEVAWKYFCRDVVPFTAMVAVECVTVGSNTLFKAATMRGLSFYVFVFYNYVVATLVLLPLSLLFRRSRRLPSAKSSVFFKIFLLALVGGNRFMSGIAGCKGIEYSSPTLASAISPKILASSTTVSHDQHLTISESSWIIGGLLIAAQYLLVSIWLILQTRIMEGGLISSLGSVIHTWGLHLKGPVYISLFKLLICLESG
ncbi:WAT1-related protein At5g40230-like [Brassica napus]|uniref:WAT1-related protein At5g40230-like n=1 Tax=Brassica napus TaxID=3708 RepID=UPI00207ADCFF|nr:WAT1-related protein At5g40230-like [Brassica napus]